MRSLQVSFLPLAESALGLPGKTSILGPGEEWLAGSSLSCYSLLTTEAAPPFPPFHVFRCFRETPEAAFGELQMRLFVCMPLVTNLRDFILFHFFIYF